MDRPCLIWDGDCGFCRRSAQHLRARIGEGIAFEPYQTAHTRFPEIPREGVPAVLAGIAILVGLPGSLSARERR